ncbi:MAG: DUF1573 domain-containing protein [Candidatus Cryptobacteroides sp.]
MKSGLHICLLLSLFLFCACNSGAEKIYRADAQGNINIGKVKEADGPVHLKVVWTNNTDEELRVVSSRSACSCTQLELKAVRVAPGEELEFGITYNPAYRPADVTEKFVILFEGGKFVDMALKASVVQAVHPMKEDCRYDFGEGLFVSYSVLPLGRMAAGEESTMSFRLGNANKKAAKVEFRSEHPHASAAKFRRSIRLKADQRDTLHVHFTMPSGLNPGDTLLIPFQPYVNGRPTESTLTVRAYVKE